MLPDAKIPAGPMADKWDNHKFDIKLVNPANKRKFTIIVVGTGLAGASAAATLGELGYNVEVFGEAGRHSRFAVGSNALPFGVAVEIAAIFEIDG